MRIKRITLSFLLLFQCLCQIASADNGQGSLLTGDIIEALQCRNDKSESYSLLLPQDYYKQTEREWPLLIAFDPAGRGKVPLLHFKDAALSYGIILVCPINSRNGPFQPVVKAMRSVWQDVIQRFRINRERVYATGFSGGARVATFLSQVIQNPIQGIIACGAGLSSSIKPDQLRCPLYFGLAGLSDFNYQEMRRLDRTLDPFPITHHFHYFQGNHQWPDKELCTMAWQWMEIQSARMRISPLPVSKIQAIYAHHLSRIKQRESSGDIYFSVHEYRSLVAAFDQWIELSSIKAKINNLTNSIPYKKFSKQEVEREKKEDVYLRKTVGAFTRINQSPPDEIKINRISHWLGMARLKSLAEKKEPFIHAFGRRLLYTIASHAEEEAKHKMEKGEYDRALLFIKLAVNAGKKYYYYPSLLYNMARIYAGKKRVKKTIKILKQVKEITAVDAKFIRNDPYMKNLLQDSVFQKYLDSLSKNKEVKN